MGCATWRSAFSSSRCCPKSKNVYGRSRACAIALAMRYVVVIAAIAFFLIWDGLYNQGRYLDISVRELSHAVRYVTGKA
ncbi:hypothetical protein DBIPINDM_006397 [Mesorhizobium sp. AR02]|nr:hypothetical protein DBIPINDM_006397 [Mesorhizobium sp. AR02]